MCTKKSDLSHLKYDTAETKCHEKHANHPKCRTATLADYAGAAFFDSSHARHRILARGKGICRGESGHDDSPRRNRGPSGRNAFQPYARRVLCKGRDELSAGKPIRADPAIRTVQPEQCEQGIPAAVFPLGQSDLPDRRNQDSGVDSRRRYPNAEQRPVPGARRTGSGDLGRRHDPFAKAQHQRFDGSRPPAAASRYVCDP